MMGQIEKLFTSVEDLSACSLNHLNKSEILASIFHEIVDVASEKMKHLSEEQSTALVKELKDALKKASDSLKNDYEYYYRETPAPLAQDKKSIRNFLETQYHDDSKNNYFHQYQFKQPI